MCKLHVLDGESLQDVTLYCQLVGSVIYFTITRPEMFYVVHLVNQFMATPWSTHYDDVLHILHYVLRTLFHGLYFTSMSSLELCAYSNAD